MNISLQKIRKYYDGGHTRTYHFRKQQLERLKNAILRFENEIHEALYSDLKKGPEESWVTETGFVVAEIRHAIKNLGSWMKPEKVRTNLMNFPSKSFIYKEPLGVVLIIGPWNYPFQLLMAPLVGAVAAGNCVVLKLPEYAPATSAIIKKMMKENFPQEYIYVVEGRGAEVIPPMMDAFRFDHVFYTGSTIVGRSIYEMAATKLVPVTLELGGKSPCIVEDDANIKVTARRIALTRFSNAGQMCVAPDYILAHTSVKDELIRELKRSLLQFYSDDASTSTSYGKIINEKHFDRLVKYLEEGSVVYGGKCNRALLYIEPTIIENLPEDSLLMNEEIFGPILPVATFSDAREARKIIERNPDPLAFYVFTRNMKKAEKWLSEISFGGGCVNSTSWHLTNFNLPFGGVGNSGFGSYHGKYTFDTFSHKKSIMKTPLWFDPSVKYPPFAGKLNLFKKIIR